MSEDEDDSLVDAARQGSEAAFAALVDRYHSRAVRLASQFVRSAASAEDAAQDAWLAAIAGLASFEGRSSFKTWFFSIVANCARKRAAKEARAVPVEMIEPDADAPSVPAEMFATAGRWPGHWASPPTPWGEAEIITMEREVKSTLNAALEALTGGQREVFTLRDVLGLSSREASAMLDITETHQRVLLHRARSRVRAALEAVLGWSA